jgi:hypothetical protein
MKEILRRQHSPAIFSSISPASLLDVSDGSCQRALVDESGAIRNWLGTHNNSEMVAM